MRNIVTMTANIRTLPCRFSHIVRHGEQSPVPNLAEGTSSTTFRDTDMSRTRFEKQIVEEVKATPVGRCTNCTASGAGCGLQGEQSKKKRQGQRPQDQVQDARQPQMDHSTSPTTSQAGRTLNCRVCSRPQPQCQRWLARVKRKGQQRLRAHWTLQLNVNGEHALAKHHVLIHHLWLILPSLHQMIMTHASRLLVLTTPYCLCGRCVRITIQSIKAKMVLLKVVDTLS